MRVRECESHMNVVRQSMIAKRDEESWRELERTRRLSGWGRHTSAVPPSAENVERSEVRGKDLRAEHIQGSWACAWLEVEHCTNHWP